jgi:hypothetical protein
MDDSRIRKVSDLLGMLLSPAMRDKADSWTRFSGFWKHAAGDNLAAHSRIADVRNGIVFVETEHPGWIQLLQMRQNQILDEIKRTFPELGVSGIAFRLAKDASPPGTARLTFTGGGDLADDSNTGDDLEAAAMDQQASGDEEQARNGDGKEKKSVEQTIEAVVDESFRSVLSSLAGTLEKENRASKKRWAPGQKPDPA